MTEPEFTIEPCEHGGVWLSRKGGESGQVKGAHLVKLMKLLEEFWKEWF